jgi:hypothetical protein
MSTETTFDIKLLICGIKKLNNWLITTSNYQLSIMSITGTICNLLKMSETSQGLQCTMVKQLNL